MMIIISIIITDLQNQQHAEHPSVSLVGLPFRAFIINQPAARWPLISSGRRAAEAADFSLAG